jgi:acetyl esterase
MLGMLDPQARAFLDDLKARGVAPLESLSPEANRASMAADAAAQGPPQSLARIEDRCVSGPGGEIPIRIFVPEEPTPMGVLVYFHGGGWVVGNLDTHQHLCADVANAGKCIVVAVDYRLAPEHKFPAAAEDAFAATQWAMHKPGRFGGDPRRVAVGGDSAGGNLAAAVTLMARDQGAPQPAFQLLVYPILDHDYTTPSYQENAEGYYLTRSTMEWFWDCYLADKEDGKHPYASPLRAGDLGGLPPGLVITAEYDPLRDEGEAYARRLIAAGVPATLSRYDGMIHGFLRRTAIFAQARTALEEIGASLRAALGPVR